MKLLGYNTHLFGDNLASKIAQFFGGETLIYKDGERTNAIVAALNGSGADVVGLVEVWDDDLAASIVSGTQGTFPYSFRPHTPPNVLSQKFLGSGLLLLSRHALTTPVTPFSNAPFFPYNQLAGSDDYSQKGIAVQRIAGFNFGAVKKDVLLFLTHDQAAYEGDPHTQVRKANLIQLVQTIQDFQKAYPDGLCFAFGDLNVVGEQSGKPTQEYSTMVSLFASAGLSDSYRSLHPDPQTDPGITYGYDGTHNDLIPIFSKADAAAKVQQRLDYTFAPLSEVETTFSRALDTQYRLPDGTDLSDHYPLEETFAPMTIQGSARASSADRPDTAEQQAIVIEGDCRKVLPELPAGSADCCITSPPYWAGSEAAGDGYDGFGVEPDLDTYAAKLVEVFGQVRRILRHRGTLWLVLGETAHARRSSCHAPWEVARALCRDGWHLARDVVWSKPDEAHDYVFAFTASPEDPIGVEPSEDVWSVDPETGPEEYGFSVLPEALVARCILAGSPAGGTVLDPFCGTGSVGHAALCHGRSFVGVEYSPRATQLARLRLRESCPSVATVRSRSSAEDPDPGHGPDRAGAVGAAALTTSPTEVGARVRTPRGGADALAVESGPAAGDAVTGSSCAGGDASPVLAYVLGRIGFDLGSEASRDALVQGGLPTPQEPRELLNHLTRQPARATAVHWTLNQVATPVYAIQPEGAFAAETYARLREFLGDQLTGNVQQVSIPGRVAGQVTLLNGHTVPVIRPELRGMFSWATVPLIQAIGGDPEDSGAGREKVEGFLRRVYHDLRNLGLAPQERAINFAGTHAFQAASVFRKVIASDLELNSIAVERNQICRPGSDCWDVRLEFFHPKKRQEHAREVHRFTIDVSDVIPVAVGEIRSWHEY